MFQVLKDGVIYSAVAEIDGRWIDGCSGEDVTDGKLLGTFIGSKYGFNGGRYTYYRNERNIYQLTPDGDYLWFCDASVEDAFKSVMGVS